MLEYKITNKGIVVAKLNSAIYPASLRRLTPLKYGNHGQKKICRPFYVDGYYHRGGDVPLRRL